MENILWLILGHYICDYPLQGDYLAELKTKNWYNLFVHSVIYGLGMAFVLKLLGTFAIWKALVLVTSHIIIDYKKIKAKDKKKTSTMYLYLDQFLHIIINYVLYVV